MIRNKNARRRIRENRKAILAYIEESGWRRSSTVWDGPMKLHTHVMIARAGNDSLPLRRGWTAMRAKAARS
jgi:hypothetical protein